MGRCSLLKKQDQTLILQFGMGWAGNGTRWVNNQWHIGIPSSSSRKISRYQRLHLQEIHRVTFYRLEAWYRWCCQAQDGCYITQWVGTPALPFPGEYVMTRQKNTNIKLHFLSSIIWDRMVKTMTHTISESNHFIFNLRKIYFERERKRKSIWVRKGQGEERDYLKQAPH